MKGVGVATGAGVSIGVGVAGFAAAALALLRDTTLTPLFQTSFLPDLMHVCLTDLNV